MKTFEDMKNAIPHGATHYSNETESEAFAWRNSGGLIFIPDDSGEWCLDDSLHGSIWIEIPEALEEPKQAEWKNGDECVFDGKEYIFVSLSPYNKDIAILQGSIGRPISPLVSAISKPETPEQKEKRERLEAAYDLYCEWCLVMGYPKFSFEQFTETDKDKTAMLAIVDKTNYRK